MYSNIIHINTICLNCCLIIVNKTFIHSFIHSFALSNISNKVNMAKRCDIKPYSLNAARHTQKAQLSQIVLNFSHRRFIDMLYSSLHSLISTQRHVHTPQSRRLIPRQQSQKPHQWVALRWVGSRVAGNDGHSNHQTRLALPQFPQQHFGHRLILREMNVTQIGIESGAEAVQEVIRIVKLFAYLWQTHNRKTFEKPTGTQANIEPIIGVINRSHVVSTTWWSEVLNRIGRLRRRMDIEGCDLSCFG